MTQRPLATLLPPCVGRWRVRPSLHKVSGGYPGCSGRTGVPIGCRGSSDALSAAAQSTEPRIAVALAAQQICAGDALHRLIVLQLRGRKTPKIPQNPHSAQSDSGPGSGSPCTRQRAVFQRSPHRSSQSPPHRRFCCFSTHRPKIRELILPCSPATSSMVARRAFTASDAVAGADTASFDFSISFSGAPFAVAHGAVGCHQDCRELLAFRLIQLRPFD